MSYRGASKKAPVFSPQLEQLSAVTVQAVSTARLLRRVRRCALRRSAAAAVDEDEERPMLMTDLLRLQREVSTAAEADAIDAAPAAAICASIHCAKGCAQ